MDFMTIKQASEKWGICTRRVQTLCTEGRIDGAERLGHQWVILDLCQYFEHKKLKGYADFFNSSSSFCCGVI